MTVLAVSPHLDDAAFSAGGTLAMLAASGLEVVIATVFTRSVPNPTGFALACQTDKGIAPEADYLALRRLEDTGACVRLGAEPVWLDLPEAPHRGYHTPAALFGDVLPADRSTWRAVLEGVQALVAARQPSLVLSCQGLGRHVDHEHVVRAVASLEGVPVAWWRDTPYAIRGGSEPADSLPSGVLEDTVSLSESALEAKLDACTAYASQIQYQFARDNLTDVADSPETATRSALRSFAQAEGRRLGTPLAEAFQATPADLDVLAAALEDERARLA